MKKVSYLVLSTVALVGWMGALAGQSCPSPCTAITSGPVIFCRCHIYTTSDSSDRVQLVTDEPLTIVDVDGDGLRDIPFGIYYYGREGTYILRQISGGIPGTFTEIQISSLSTYGITSIGDINGDGFIDFAIAQQERGRNVYILRSSSSWVYSSFLVHNGYRPNSISGYFDGTNVHLYWTDYNTRAFYFNGSRVISSDTNMCADGITYADFNLDSWIDVACSSYKPPIGLRVLFYDPLVGFSSSYTVDNTRKWQGIVSYDFDGDGDVDIAAVGKDVSIFYNDGDGLSWTEEILVEDFSTGANPFARINVGDMDCDGDVDIVVATAVPNSYHSGASLMWIENDLPTGWYPHIIDTYGNSSDVYRPYPYGVRVGYLNENTHSSVGGLDIVIVRERSNFIWAYYNSMECPIGDTSELNIGEKEKGEIPQVPVQVDVDGKEIKVYTATPTYIQIFKASGEKVWGSTITSSHDVQLPAPGVYILIWENSQGRGHKKVLIR